MTALQTAYPAILLMSAILAGCGGGSGSSSNSGNPTSSPTPSPTPSPFVELRFDYEAHRFATSDRVPEYTYAGVTYPAAVADIFPQGSLSADFQKDGYPELVIPLNKAYGTPAYAALPYVLLSNSNGRLSYSAPLNAQLPSVFGARRSAILSVAGQPSAFFVAHNVSGVYNEPEAHGTAVLLGQIDNVIGRISTAIPRITTNPDRPDDATDAHSMATGDINGDGLDDIAIGNWNPGGGFAPLFLIQQEGGNFRVSSDTFLERLLQLPMVNSGSTGNEGFNLLLDLHLADVNADGFSDLIAGFGHGSAYSLLFMNNNGTFDFAQQIRLPPTVYGVDANMHLETRSVDLDNDGDLDLVLLHSRISPYYAGTYLQVLRNDAGQFADVTPNAIVQEDRYVRANRLEWTSDLFLRDIDRDGKVDIIHGLYDGQLAVFFNQGSMKFGKLTASLPNNENGRLLAVDDFEKDGGYELAYYQYGGSASEKAYFVNVYNVAFSKP